MMGKVLVETEDSLARGMLWANWVTAWRSSLISLRISLII